MQITLVTVGKIKEQYLKEAINEYIKRLSPYSKINIIEVMDEPIVDNPSKKEIEKAIDKEGEKILSHLPSNSYVINLDLNKKEYDSIEFASFLQKRIDIYSNHLVFVIGGSYGLSEKVKNNAKESISISKMTFTHQMTRLLLLEQIYRAFKINNNETYHK